jgi:hypothetical protein
MMPRTSDLRHELRFAASTATSVSKPCCIQTLLHLGRDLTCWNFENVMRAEVERLVEEIKQSVGLLRRHL